MNYIDQRLSDIAINIPRVTELFRKYHLDFCCGGRQTLSEACAQQNLDAGHIEQEITNLAPPLLENEFSSMPLTKFTEHIVLRYHDDLRQRMPELILLATKVEQVHESHPSVPKGLSSMLTHVREELFLHMQKEENVLFPLINEGRGSTAMMPIKVMNSEHDEHGKQLIALRSMTNNFTVPTDACATWLALYRGLEELEKELMEHIHLENNLLFPRALA